LLRYRFSGTKIKKHQRESAVFRKAYSSLAETAFARALTGYKKRKNPVELLYQRQGKKALLAANACERFAFNFSDDKKFKRVLSR
jgi:hypothetical protein